MQTGGLGNFPRPGVLSPQLAGLAGGAFSGTPRGIPGGGVPAQPATSPLLRIRAGIEAGNAEEVLSGVQAADSSGVALAQNVRDMIIQWLVVNPPPAELAPMVESLGLVRGSKPTAQPMASAGSPASPQQQSFHQQPQLLMPTTPAQPMQPEAQQLQPMPHQQFQPPQREQPQQRQEQPPSALSGEVTVDVKASEAKSSRISLEILREALLSFFRAAPEGSDAALGLGIMETEDNKRFLPLHILGRAVGLEGQDFEVAHVVWQQIEGAPRGVITLSSDARGAGLAEWAGWEEFSVSLDKIVQGTRDPAFEPRSIQAAVATAAHGAVRCGPVRQADVLLRLTDSLSPQTLPEDTAPALRSAISRRARLALACLVDAIVAESFGGKASPDAMGLVGRLPKMVFGLIFDNVDDRDRGACAFLGEMLESWDERRCFSKRWLQDQAGKFSRPRGANPERDEGRGWYALIAANLHKRLLTEPAMAGTSISAAEAIGPASASSPPPEQEREGIDSRRGRGKRVSVQDDEDDETVAKHLEESRKRRAALMSKYDDDGR